MDRLYRKSELGFSLVWIGLYVLLFSLADGISQSLGVEKLLTAPLGALLSLVLFLWLRKWGHLENYGLCAFRGTARDYLYFLPLALLVSVNLWGGMELRLSPLESLFSVIAMLFVGFLEELIFRGLLFQALLKSNSVKIAILIASLTFGIGHIVNLLNGAAFLATLLQLFYACMAGFLFTVLVYRGKSLWPCIFCHSALNALGVFSPEAQSLGMELLSALFLSLVSFAYGLYILKIKAKEA